MKLSDCKYTSVGARKTPPEILMLQSRFVYILNRIGVTVRTGDARDGADSWTRRSVKWNDRLIEVYAPRHNTMESLQLASEVHPYWNNCKIEYQRLHGRNTFQVLGINLDEPSSFLICYTPSGAITQEERLANFNGTGGTGQAIAIAEKFGVPVYNLGRSDHKALVEDFVYKGIPFDESLSKWLEMAQIAKIHFTSPDETNLVIERPDNYNF